MNQNGLRHDGSIFLNDILDERQVRVSQGRLDMRDRAFQLAILAAEERIFVVARGIGKFGSEFY
mgnify:CR=1 FL=1